VKPPDAGAVPPWVEAGAEAEVEVVPVPKLKPAGEGAAEEPAVAGVSGILNSVVAGALGFCTATL